MQVASWLPRVELPFAAPSRPELLQPLPEPEAPAEQAAPVATVVREAPPAPPAERPKIEVPRPGAQARQQAEPVVEEAVVEDKPPRASQPVPRFGLQLPRAGD